MSFSIEELLKNSPLGKGPNEAQKKKNFLFEFLLDFIPKRISFCTKMPNFMF